MSNQRWLWMTMITTILIAVLFSGFMMTDDVYGIFRNPSGRQISIYYADREGKALLSAKYVPANFDALLLGPSSSVNWHPEIIQQGFGFRMYNESLEGGNSLEEKYLADQALKQGHFRVAMIVLFPTMISTHAYHDAVDKNSWTEGLGSINSITQLVMATMKAHHIPFRKEEARPDGSHEMRHPGGMEPNPNIDFGVDPVGLHNLKTLTSELQQHGIKIVYIVPPIYEAVYQQHSAEFAAFQENMMHELAAGPLIDLNGPEYKMFRSDTANYRDDFHLSTKGAIEISEVLHGRLEDILHVEPS